MKCSNIQQVVNLHAIGALTAGGGKVPHTFRPWEIQSIDSIDLRDSTLGSVRYQVRGGQLRRVLPRVNDKINGEWATDKGRYAPLDGATVQEVRTPRISVKSTTGNTWENIKLSTALQELSKRKASSVRVIYGGTTDCEAIVALTNWCSTNGIVLETRSPVSPKANPLNVFDSTQSEVGFVPNGEKRVKGLLIGCDPRIQSPLLNLQLRERYLEGTEFYNVGSSLDLTYPVQHLGLSSASLKRLQGQNAAWDFVLVGSDIYRRKDAAAVLNQVKTVSGDSQVRVCTTRTNEAFIRNHTETSAYDANSTYELQFLVNLTSNEINAAGYDRNEVLRKGKTNVVVTSKGANWMKSAKLILPILNALETKSTYVSRVGGVRQSEKIIVRNDGVLSLANLVDALASVVKASKGTTKTNGDSSYGEATNTPLTVAMVDYHLEGHSFAEASATRARCSAVFTHNRTNFATS